MSQLDDLLRKLDDLHRRLGAQERIETSSSGLPATVVKYSGTPTAGAVAYWTGNGTVAHWSFGTADVALLGAANTWTNNQTIAGTATAGTTLAVTRNLTATSTDSPVVSIVQDHASDDQDALRVQQDGTGDVIELLDGATVVLRLLDGGRLDVYNIIRALTSSGLRLEDDAGNLGIFIEDATGDVAIGTSTTPADIRLYVYDAAGASRIHVETGAATDASVFFTTPSGLILFGATGAANSILTGTGANDFAISARAGGAIRISADVGFAASEGINLMETGELGIGVTAPQGFVHAYDGVGGQMFVTKTGIAGVAVVLHTNTTGDVGKVARLDGVAYDSTGAAHGIFVTAANGVDQDAINDGTNIVKFRVNADGSCDVRRTGGTRTYSIACTLTWLA